MATKKEPWTPENWEDGHWASTTSGMRFSVHRPDYPTTRKPFRYQVVWWLVNGKPPKGSVVHHKDFDTTNDRYENLAEMTASDHIRLHHEKNPPVSMQCPGCQKMFTVQWNIISQHHREGRKTGQKYCTPECYWKCKKGSRGHSRYGMTPEIVIKIRKLSEMGATIQELADLCEIKPTTIRAIVTRQNWRNVA